MPRSCLRSLNRVPQTPRMAMVDMRLCVSAPSVIRTRISSEGRDLLQVFAGAEQRYQGQVRPQFVEQLRRVIAQEHFAATPLPAQVIHVVDVARLVSSKPTTCRYS